MANSTPLYCPCCGNLKNTMQFITDYRKSGSYLPLCRSCTDRLVLGRIGDYSLDTAVWCGAMANNVPFIREVWEEAKVNIAEMNAKSPFAIYYRFLKDRYGVYQGVWESDCWMGDFDKIFTEEVEEEAQPEEQKPLFTPEEIIELSKEWGRFVLNTGEIDYEAYEFVTQRYDEYTEGLSGLTSAMSMQFKNLCKAEWQKIKADEGGDIAEIEKAQKLVNNLLSNLKLDDFAVEKSDIDRFIDRLIWRIEETEPAEDEDMTKYQDVAGYEAMYNSIMRSMQNMIAGTRNYPDVPLEEV